MSDASPTSVPPPVMPAVEDRTVAILSYITLLGFIIAIVMHSNKKTQLGSFHLRQMLGLFICAVVAFVPCMMIALIPLLNLSLIIIYPLLLLVFFIAWLIGLIGAASGSQTPIPIFGPLFQQWFANAF